MADKEPAKTQDQIDKEKTTKTPEQRQEPEQRQAQEPDAEGNVLIECMMGPYRGQMLKVPQAEGTQAISDKWARDPVHTIDASKEITTLTQEETATALEAANAAAAKLRGEDTAEPKEESSAKSKSGRSEETRNMLAAPDQGQAYETKANQAPDPKARK